MCCDNIGQEHRSNHASYILHTALGTEETYSDICAPDIARAVNMESEDEVSICSSHPLSHR
jgi:hypothetical protein